MATIVKKTKIDRQAEDATYAARLAAVKPPEWFKGSYWQKERLLSPGAAYAWDVSLGWLVDTYHDWEWKYCPLFEALPPSFRSRCGVRFQRKFVPVLEFVHTSLFSGEDFRWNSLAEELAIRILTDSAVGHAEMNWDQHRCGFPSLSFVHSWDARLAEDFRQYIVEDTDVDWLYEPGWRGYEDRKLMYLLGCNGDFFRFENWFEPYRDQR